MPEFAPIDRRRFLGQMGRATAGTLLLPLVPDAARAQAGDLRPISMAMHVHASFSEGEGSMEAQLYQAARQNVDVLWWTEHDWRMSAHKYRQAVHFTALAEKEGNLVWTWQPVSDGTLRSSDGGIVSSPASPRDPAAPGSLRVAATADSGTFAKYGYLAFTGRSRENMRTSLAGQTLDIEVYPMSTGPDAFLEVHIVASKRPARQGRRAGTYRLSYRIGGPGAPGSRVAEGLTGIVTLAAESGQWNQLTLSPADDITAIWPDIDGRDSGLFDLSLYAASRNGAAAQGCFDYLRFNRTANAGDLPLAVQADLMRRYEAEYPTVRQHGGLEVSLGSPHLNWFGGQVSLPDYGNRGLRSGDDPALTRQLAEDIYARGGIASYNHPFGAGAGPALSDTQQEAARRQVASDLIRERAFGVDILEVGYRLREGVTLARHAAAWDACSRNGIFLTGTGVNDNHNAGDWSVQKSNFVTWAWATGTGEATLLQALTAGRIYFGDPGRFSGMLDLTVDGACPMGSVSVSTRTTRDLTIQATGVPTDGAVQVVRGLVDYAGETAPDPKNTVSTLPASHFASGRTTISVNTGRSVYVRVIVLDRNGLELALSNPVWLLRAPPPGGIPVARRC